MASNSNFKNLNPEILKYLAVNSSPLTAAIALAILDELTGGKVTEFKEKYVDAPSLAVKRVRVPQGANGR